MQKYARICLAFSLLLTLITPISQAQSVVPDSLARAFKACRNDKECLRLQLDVCDYLLFASPVEADSICYDALRMSNDMNDTLALAKSLNYVGILATIQARYLTGIEHFQDALTYYEALNDPIGIQKLLNNIGVIYSSLEDYEESNRYFERSFELNTKNNDYEGAAFNLHNIASNYLQLENVPEARKFTDSLLNYQSAHGEFINPYKLLGAIYLTEEKLDSAEYYLLRAVDHARKVNEEHTIASSFLALATICRKKSWFDQALSYVNRAEQSALKNELNTELVEVHLLRAEIYRDQGAFDKAFESHTLYVAKKDSLDEVNNFNQISELNARFNSERREKELAEKEALLIQRDASEKMQQRVFILITAFIFVVLAMVSFSLMRKRKMNRILNLQNAEIEEQQQKIISSINYAKKIQQAILLPEEEIKQLLPNAFIYFRPKDIVSGDFYWFAEIDGAIYFAAIDCTGHGVPGAFMSLIANSKLNKVVLEMGVRDPGKILNCVHEEIIASLNQNLELSDTQDGMDMSICVLEKGRPIRYAGARAPLMRISAGVATELKTDNLAIGGTFFRDHNMPNGGFVTREISYTAGDYIFLYTDGFVDQFGGESNKKLNKQNFQKILCTIAGDVSADPKAILDAELSRWRREIPQLDDILIMGVLLD